MKWVAGLVLWTTACGASESAKLEPPDPAFVPPPCATAPLGPAREPDGTFVQKGDSGYARIGGIVNTGEGSTVAVTSPEPGTLCVTGTLQPAGPYKGGWSELVLAVDDRSDMGTCVRAVLDARALGVASVQFDLDQVPATRMYVSAAAILKTECDDAYECVDGGVCTLLTHDRQDLVLVQPGTNNAPLEDFVSNTADAPLDTTRISYFSLRLEPTDKQLDYAYCVSQIRFLDAAGGEVVVAAP